MFIHYPSLAFLGIAHALALASIPYMHFNGIHAWEAIFHLIAMLAGGFGITALYHRAWAHNVCFLRGR
jgi:fatty-acid desaturase